VWISCPSTGASTHYDLGYNVVLQLLLGNRDFGHPHRCSTLVAVNIQSYSIPVANHLGIILHHPYRVTPNKYQLGIVSEILD
jgi:hypothetical protein